MNSVAPGNISVHGRKRLEMDFYKQQLRLRSNLEKARSAKNEEVGQAAVNSVAPGDISVHGRKRLGNGLLQGTITFTQQPGKSTLGKKRRKSEHQRKD